MSTVILRAEPSLPEGSRQREHSAKTSVKERSAPSYGSKDSTALSSAKAGRTAKLQAKPSGASLLRTLGIGALTLLGAGPARADQSAALGRRALAGPGGRRLHDDNTYYDNVFVDSDVAADVQKALDYLAPSSTAMNTFQELRGASLNGHNLQIRKGSETSFHPGINVIDFASTEKRLYDSHGGNAGVISPALTLAGVFKHAADASENFVHYLTEATIPHPTHDTLADLHAQDFSNTVAQELSTGEGLIDGHVTNAYRTATANDPTEHSLSGFSTDDLASADNVRILTADDTNTQNTFFANLDSEYSTDVGTYSNRFSDFARTTRSTFASQGGDLSRDLAGIVTLHDIDSTRQAQIDAFVDLAESAIKNI